MDRVRFFRVLCVLAGVSAVAGCAEPRHILSEGQERRERDLAIRRDMVPGAESAAMDVELKGIRNRWFVEMDTDGRSYPAADTAKEKEAAINRMLDEQISAQLQKR